LATFAADLDGTRLPAALREKLGFLLLDYLRVCSIGARLPWSEWARSYADGVARAGSSRVLFTADALNPEHATFVNAAFRSSCEAADPRGGALLTRGAPAWAGAWPGAERGGASGPDVAAAVVAGYEIAIRIGLAVQPSHFKRGFQSTGTCDAFGTAAAAARLLFGGDQQRILAAIGLAGSYPSGVAQFYYSASSAHRIPAAPAPHT